MSYRIGVAVVAVLLLGPASAWALVLPPDGIVLRQIHVQFEWPAVGGAANYEFEVVEDDASPDPFSGATPVVDTLVPGSEPRTVVTSGLAFDAEYAWRVRDVNGSPGPWSATYRFVVQPLPTELPNLAVTVFGPGGQPGLTLFGVRRQNGSTLSGSYLLAITEAGEIVWYLHGSENIGDARLLDSGRVLYQHIGQAVEATLNGQIAWKSPDDLAVHHETFPMPGGDVLVLTTEVQTIEYMGDTKDWEGDRLVVLDRSNNAELWSWSTFDHVSILDRDATTYQNSGASFDWTHGNALVYNAADGDIYVSLRQLSRIVRIEYPSGAIVYNMGFDMPSGEVDFGDNLFSFQHAPELLSNGNMMVYDNGNRRDHIDQTAGTGVTKVVELAFTGSPPTSASIAWEWTLPFYNSFVGDADRLANGNTLTVSGPLRIIHEVDDLGAEVWRMTATPTGGGTFFIYRAERIDSLILDVPGDADGDGHADYADNCPDHDNADQLDGDGDGFGDVCAIALGFMTPPDPPDIELIPTLPRPALLVLTACFLAAAAWQLRAAGRAATGPRV